jgi:hypothetical protein
VCIGTGQEQDVCGGRSVLQVCFNKFRNKVFAEEEVRNRMGFGTFKIKEPRNIQDKGA